MTAIALPVRFTLPPGWRPVDPAQAGAPRAAFVAVRSASRGPTANITLGEAADRASLTEIADESLGRLVTLGRDVTLVRRTEHESAEVPGLSQLVTFSVPDAGDVQDLMQYQVFLAFVDAEDTGRRLVVEAALTTTPEEFDDAAAGFGDFVSSIRLDGPE